jgi:hypothetical protein
MPLATAKSLEIVEAASPSDYLLRGSSSPKRTRSDTLVLIEKQMKSKGRRPTQVWYHCREPGSSHTVEEQALDLGGRESVD